MTYFSKERKERKKNKHMAEYCSFPLKIKKKKKNALKYVLKYFMRSH